METQRNMDTHNEQRALAPMNEQLNWLIHSCTTPGCQVTIRVPVGEQHKHGLCKWCHGKVAYNTRNPSASYASTGPFLSRDEFGQDLFRAIELQAGSLQAFKTADLFHKKGLKFEADKAEHAARACQIELEAIFKRNTIAIEDVRRILAMV